jgi:hypothetical protein
MAAYEREADTHFLAANSHIRPKPGVDGFLIADFKVAISRHSRLSTLSVSKFILLEKPSSTPL